MGVIRKTKSVRIILDILSSSKNAFSVVDLVKQLHDQMNKTTVYRILERLEKEGTIHTFSGKDGLRWVAKRTDKDTPKKNEYHPHFQCDECGKTECIELDISIPALPNHKIDSANLILIGQCGECIS